jgi:site-specific recombinase XerC
MSILRHLSGSCANFVTGHVRRKGQVGLIVPGCDDLARHAYVTHLTEDGADRRFIQEQVGHECDSSTAVYTHVSDDFMNTALSRALAPAFAGAGE